MCIIVDANLAALVFANPCNEHYKPIINWLFSSSGSLVVGGLLLSELSRVGNAAATLRVLKQAGKLRDLSGSVLESDICELNKQKLCSSNDIHVVALARVSGARTIATEDAALMFDFKNKNIVSPTGRIYRQKRHHKLLNHNGPCGR